MVFGLWKRRKDVTPFTMYQSVMGQARHPVFFMAMNVSDTIAGRFDMLMVHAILALRRLKAIDGERGEEAADRSQNLADVLFKDLDRALRETGVGDPSMPKKMNKLAAAFFGRAKAYGEALDNKDHAALVGAVDRNVTDDAFTPEQQAVEGDSEVAQTVDSEALAHYILDADASLTAQSDDEVLLGTFAWPHLDDTPQDQSSQTARTA
jgi:cytochrome b pre-mRNA-processing protein 3